MSDFSFTLYPHVFHLFFRECALFLWWKSNFITKRIKKFLRKELCILLTWQCVECLPHAQGWNLPCPSQVFLLLCRSIPPPPNSIPPTELRGSAGHPDACVRTPRNTMPKMNSVPGLVMMGGNVMQSRLLPLAYKFSTGGMNIFLSLAVWEHTPGTGSLELYIFKVSTCALPSQEGQPISSYLEPWNCQVRDIVLTHIGETSRKPIFSSTAGGSQKWHNLPVESFGKMYLTLISTSKHSFSNEARDKTQRMFIKYYL